VLRANSMLGLCWSSVRPHKCCRSSLRRLLQLQSREGRDDLPVTIRVLREGFDSTPQPYTDKGRQVIGGPFAFSSLRTPAPKVRESLLHASEVSSTSGHMPLDGLLRPSLTRPWGEVPRSTWLGLDLAWRMIPGITRCRLLLTRCRLCLAGRSF
jgi:hypothetical protein